MSRLNELEVMEHPVRTGYWRYLECNLHSSGLLIVPQTRDTDKLLASTEATGWAMQAYGCLRPEHRPKTSWEAAARFLLSSDARDENGWFPGYYSLAGETPVREKEIYPGKHIGAICGLRDVNEGLKMAGLLAPVENLTREVERCRLLPEPHEMDCSVPYRMRDGRPMAAGTVVDELEAYWVLHCLQDMQDSQFFRSALDSWRGWYRKYHKYPFASLPSGASGYFCLARLLSDVVGAVSHPVAAYMVQAVESMQPTLDRESSMVLAAGLLTMSSILPVTRHDIDLGDTWAQALIRRIDDNGFVRRLPDVNRHDADLTGASYFALLSWIRSQRELAKYLVR